MLHNQGPEDSQSAASGGDWDSAKTWAQVAQPHLAGVGLHGQQQDSEGRRGHSVMG